MNFENKAGNQSKHSTISNTKRNIIIGIGIFFILCIYSFIFSSINNNISTSSTNIFNNTSSFNTIYSYSKTENTLEEKAENAQINTVSLKSSSSSNTKPQEKNKNIASSSKKSTTKSSNTSSSKAVASSTKSNSSSNTKSNNPSSKAKTTTTKKETNTSTTNNSLKVWVGNTGNKYHRQSCGTLKGKGHSITLKQALAEGRESCKVCKP